MEIPFSRWYTVIPERRSRRQFEPTPVVRELLEHLRTVCAEFRPSPNARAVVVTESPDRVFRGAVGPYGKIKGATAFIAFIGNMDSPHVQEEVGYTGEGIILEATSLKLSTCWVGGFFRPKVVASLIGINENERVLAVTPIGYAVERQTREERLMTGFGLTHKRRALSRIATGLPKSEWTDWIKAALEAARLAPSAVNRQPWKIHVEPDSITVSVNRRVPNFNVSRRLDCGIAMLHIEVAALNYGMKGKWEFLKPPRVARFRIL
jgi:nitroreductase